MHSLGNTVNNFYLDNCTTHHVCNDANFFENIDYSSTSSFKTAAGTVQSAGTGVVVLMFNNLQNNKRFYVELENVAYIPEAPMNLISVGLLENKSFYLNNRKKVLEKGSSAVA